jgi:hypothetical protein
VDKLVNVYGYPTTLRALEFDYSWMARGLVVDKRRGNVIKVMEERGGVVVVSEAAACCLLPLSPSLLPPPRHHPSSSTNQSLTLKPTPTKPINQPQPPTPI